MAIEIFPVPVTSSINASSITATTANTIYAAPVSLDAAIYTVTCTSSTIATVEFYSGVGTYITNAITVSGTVTINLASAADRIRLWTDTGSNIVVTVTKTASALTNNFSGTLDTITSSGTYTGTSTSGFGYVMAVGGGGGGAGNRAPNGAGGGGGGGAGVAAKLLALTGSMAVTIGAGGTAGTSATNGNPGGNGGATTISTLTANGGSGGFGSSSNAGGGGGGGGVATGGTYNLTGNGGAQGVQQGNGFGGTAISAYPFITTSIGTGGTGSGSNGNGYGAGAAGGGIAGYGSPYDGGVGAPGVVYILRFQCILYSITMGEV